MKIMQQYFIRSLILVSVLFMVTTASAQDNRVMRIAKIKIDPAYLDRYKISVKEQIETAVRVEPGVLMLHAVYDNETPTNVTVFEMYADSVAYQAHIQTAHFKKYKSGTSHMVKSLELIDVTPIALAHKQ